jgi:hypothetical protein
VFSDNTPIIGQMVERKGYTPIPVDQAWIEAAKANGVRTVDSILTDNDRVGREFLPSTPAVDEVTAKVWAKLGSLGFTFGKEPPATGTFSEPINCESRAAGLYRPEVKTVYAHQEFAQSADEKLYIIMIEEVVHHISGATDYSRDFQTMLVQVIARMMM